MGTYNQEIIKTLEQNGATPAFIQQYSQEVDPRINDLEYLGNYWTQKVAALALIDRPTTDICIYLRDVRSWPSWFDRFKNDVAPLICGEPVHVG